MSQTALEINIAEYDAMSPQSITDVSHGDRQHRVTRKSIKWKLNRIDGALMSDIGMIYHMKEYIYSVSIHSHI